MFKDFKKHLKDNNYGIEEIAEDSIRGIKKGLKVHLFKDSLNDKDEYILSIANASEVLYNTIFIEDGEGYRLNHKDDNRKFNNIIDIIDYTKGNINIKI